MDGTILEALKSQNSQREESSLGRVKKIFTNAIKTAIHWESTSRFSIALKPPYFITLVGVCEVLMFCLAAKDVRDVLIYDPKRKFELWRFLTYMLLHNDFIHLSLNIVIQTVLAVPLECEQGHFRTAGVYVGGGLAGSLGASVLDNESLLVGASAGIYALLISQISHIILNYKTLNYVIYRSLAVFLLALADVLYICYHAYVFNNESPRISLAAHFAGALAGLLLGALFFNGTLKWRNFLRMLTALVVLMLLVLGICFNITTTVECN